MFYNADLLWYTLGEKSTDMTIALFTLISYLCGSLPFSVWLARWALGVDVRQVGEDRNPGSANVFKAAGKSKWWIGMSALLLDGFKGLIPVAIATYNFHITGWSLVPVALAPIIGHAYSVFLGFKGGKAVATTFGIWTAITVYRAPLVLGGFFILFSLTLSSSAWSVMLGMLGLLGYLLISHAEAWLLAIWTGNMFILIIKHWTELRQPVGLNPRFKKPAKY
jgi:acyl phosphate:glycerol-3-phosphate acyltransferase